MQMPRDLHSVLKSGSGPGVRSFPQEVSASFESSARRIAAECQASSFPRWSRRKSRAELLPDGRQKVDVRE
jgi:hypothetical protein